MNIVVDTSAWSLLLRRERRNEENAFLKRLRLFLQREDIIYLVGPVLQELLDGIKHQKQFDLLVEYLEPFPIIECTRTDFITAARLKNLCRSKGVQAGSVDFLIAAACVNRKYPLLTSDNDFSLIAKYCPLILDWSGDADGGTKDRSKGGKDGAVDADFEVVK
ncbi:MAG: PIN domain-containing protein [Chitinispirillaceae bacterium]|nr:PIN domain-containing protein [Chitinispirillaceae bacterium]